MTVSRVSARFCRLLLLSFEFHQKMLQITGRVHEKVIRYAFLNKFGRILQRVQYLVVLTTELQIKQIKQIISHHGNHGHLNNYLHI